MPVDQRRIVPNPGRAFATPRVAMGRGPLTQYDEQMFLWNQLARAAQAQAAPAMPVPPAAAFQAAAPPPGLRPNWSMFPQVNLPTGSPFVFGGNPQPRAAAPQRKPAPKSPAQQQGGGWGGVFANAFMNPGSVISGPQGPDEMRISYGARRAGGAALQGVKSIMPFGNSGPAIERTGRDIGNAVSQAFNYMTATPNSDIERAYQALIVRQESNGKQFDANGNPLVGRDRQGNVPGAARGGPAIGVAQIQEGTAKDTAQRHGIQWSAQAWQNDPQYNYRLGLLHFQDRVQARGGDVVTAAADYHSGQGNVNKAIARHGAQNFVQGLGPEGQSYVQTVMSRMGQLAGAFGAPAPGFNAAPYQNAMAAQDRAAAMLTTPYEATFNEMPLPERPAPTELAAPDFAQGNAAFEATRPKNPFDDPKEAVRLQRQQYFKGIGQAMASLSGGEGIGTMLMKLGAGALMGRARGQEMVDAKEEQFEQNMQEFNRALASRNDQQAVAAANVLNQNIQQRNQYADQIWADSVAQIQKKQPQVVNDKLITYERDPSDPNKWTMNVTPLGYGIQAEALLNKANIGIQMGQAQASSAQFAYQSQQATARTALGLTTQLALQEGNGQAGAEGYTTMAAMQARAAVRTGNWRSFFNSPTNADRLELAATQRAYTKLGIETRPDGQPKMPLDGQMAGQFAEAFEDAMTDVIYNEAARLGQLDRLFNNSAGRNALLTQQTGSQRRTSRTDARGRTTTSTSWTLDE